MQVLIYLEHLDAMFYEFSQSMSFVSLYMNIYIYIYIYIYISNYSIIKFEMPIID